MAGSILIGEKIIEFNLLYNSQPPLSFGEAPFPETGLASNLLILDHFGVESSMTLEMKKHALYSYHIDS